MVMSGQKTRLGCIAFSIFFLGGCSNWSTPQPVSPILQPLVSQAASAKEVIIPDSLIFGVAWLTPADDTMTLPERATEKLIHQIREHYSHPGLSWKVARVDPVTSVDLSTLQRLGQDQGATHMLIVAPTVQEITVSEKFGVPKSGFWLGSRTESQVFLEAVAIELKTGLPIFEAQGNGQASLEALEYGSFGQFPRIFRGVYAPGDGPIYFPEGGREDFLPHEVRVVASNDALARLLYKMDRLKTSTPS